VTVKPALSGLVTLVRLSSFSSAEVDTVMEGCVLLSSPLFLLKCLLSTRLFRHIRMKGLVQDVRFKVFSIIDSLVAFHREGMLYRRLIFSRAC